MQPKILKFFILFFVLTGFIAATVLWAGDTGKIKGVVQDSKSKQPLVGARIEVEGTTLGAVSRPDGSFHILNVPPGTYTVKAVYIGYQTVLQTDIRINADVTAEANFNLAEAPIEMAPIEVSGRKVIDKYETANLRRISTEQIKNMPVKNVDELLATQVGFVTKNNELHVRGGRAGEVLYMVDGVATRDPLGGLGAVKGGMSISSQNIEEVSVLKGGFDAEYGNTQSAIINIVTKEGNPTSTKGYFEFLTDDFGDSKLNKYSFNTDRVELQLNGPDPLISKHLLPALGIKFLGDKLTYVVSFDAFKTNGFAPINKYAPSHLQRQFRQDDLFSWSKFGFHGTGIKIPERMYNQYTGSVKLAYKATPSKKLVFSYKRDVSRYSLFFNPSYETRGEIDLWQYRYAAANVPQYQEERKLLSLQYTHNVSRNTFYDIQLSKFDYDFLQQPGDPNNPGGGSVPGDYLFRDEWERYTDINGNGVWDGAEKFWDINGNGKYDIGEPFMDSNKEKNGIWDPGEPFTDRNGNGVFEPGVDDFNANLQDLSGDGLWNGAEPFVDTDSNGRFDPERASIAFGAAGIDLPEPFLDGDINLGEPFTDVDGNAIYEEREPFIDLAPKNGVWEPGEPWTERIFNDYYDQVLDKFITCLCPDNNDLNRNGRYDGPNDLWAAGVPFVDRNKNGKFDEKNNTWDPGEPYTDLNGNGQWDNADGFFDRGGERRQYYQNRHSTLWTLKFDLTSQIRKEHEFKSGALIEYNRLYYADIRYPYERYTGAIVDNGPWQEHGLFRNFYVREPTRGAMYIQDKLEYGTMIAKLGLRYDFYLQSEDIYQLEEEIREQQRLTRETIVRGRNKVSPRLGVSYPITDKAKVYFNYGHFYQLPEFQFIYARGTQGSTAARLVGNFNLDFQKTVSYELGIQYAISDVYRLDLSGFYKDIYGLLNTRQVTSGTFSTNFYDNNDYGRSRGLEVQLDKTYGNYVSGYVNYQYAFAYGKNSAEVSNYYASAAGGVDKIPLQEYPLDWDVRHQITVNTDILINKGDHPYLFGARMPDNWGINILWQYRTGYPFTPTREFPGEYIFLVGAQDPPKNSKRTPATSKVDLRFHKDFSIWKLDYSFSFWVNNVFNKKNVTTVYPNTGRPDTAQNPNGIVLPGREIDASPLNYEYGRNIRVGLSMQF
ncbi:MAG TPA: TonB-dependent receptor [candidate division Zixibacteria bacterium]|nr:TonB-dependent receptor [candidate division Zixibacteria bacterium]